MDTTRSQFDKYFGFLTTQHDFSILSFSAPSGWFTAELQRGNLYIKIDNDRHQIFIDFKTTGKPWEDKEDILEKLGISRNRFQTIDQLWTGYEIQNQSNDLKKHISMILNHLEGVAA